MLANKLISQKNKKISFYEKLIFIIIILIILKKNKHYRLQICLCSIGKKENLYIKEFVDHYKRLGYDKIYLYDNNDKNGERFKDVLSEYIKDNFVIIIDYIGYKKKSGGIQMEAYYDCYQKNSDKYDWLSFFDIDEFLEIKKHNSIKEFLSEKKFEKCENIKINWIMYSDNGLTYYDGRKVQERFTDPLLNDSANIHIKSTIRGHMKINYWTNSTNPHSSKINVTSCTSTGEIIKDYKSPFFIPPTYEYAYLKHYNTKTIEEFIKKVKRGWVDILQKLDNNLWKEKIKFFFRRNKKNKEKLAYIKNILNISINETFE